MSELTSVDCHLARDLFIPYLAGDVSDETRAWLERHLQECAGCRAALEELRAALAAPTAPSAHTEDQSASVMSGAPSDAPGRRLIRRVKARSVIITAVLVLAVISIIGFGVLVAWGFSTIRTFSLPPTNPVPPGGVAAADAAKADLSGAGLTFSTMTLDRDGRATTVWLDQGQHRIQVQLTNMPTQEQAFLEYERWLGAFPVRIAKLEYAIPGQSRVMARVPRSYIYAWQTDTWLVTIEVPSGADSPAALCASIRDALFRAFGEMAPAGAQSSGE